MNKTIKKRLCWNCEGSVAINEENCPFCGVSVVPASLDTPTNDGFAPSYRMATSQDSSIPRSLYSIPTTEQETEDQNDSRKEIKESEEDETTDGADEFKNVLIAVLLLLTGSVFFLFGLALALFSQEGIFTLQWDGSIWFIYSIIAVPLLLLGWKVLQRLE